jgi:hypothetical protein
MAGMVVVAAKASSARSRGVGAKPLGGSLLGRTSRAGESRLGAASNLVVGSSPEEGLRLGVGLSRSEWRRQNAQRLSGGSSLASASN